MAVPLGSCTHRVTARDNGEPINFTPVIPDPATKRGGDGAKKCQITLTPSPSPDAGEGSWFPLPGERVRVRGRPGESGLRWFNYQAQLENCGLVKKDRTSLAGLSLDLFLWNE